MSLVLLQLTLVQLDQALGSTLKFLELKPDHPDAQMKLGCINRELGQPDQSLASLKEAIKSEKKEKAGNELSQIYYYMDNYRD